MSYGNEEKKEIVGLQAAAPIATPPARNVPLPDVMAEEAAGDETTSARVNVAGTTAASAATAPSEAASTANALSEATPVEAAPAAEAGTGEPLDIAKTEELLIEALHTVFDPEIPVDIYDLGLIYDLRIQPSGEVDIKMTLTTPNCPVAGSMPGMVERVAGMVEGVKSVKVDLVWEPTWGPHMMTEAARLQLNMY